MAKLLPPMIGSTIPAFYYNNGMVKITIPFFMNRAVSKAQVKGFALKVKTAQSSSYLLTSITNNSTEFNFDGNSYVEFNIKEQELINKMKVGQFYKFQIAFIDNVDEIGYYSTIGVGKYTTKPSIAISNLSMGETNLHSYRYEGIYSQKNGDITEKAYSYQFNIYDDKEIIIASSGEKLHDSSQDVESDTSYDIFNLTMDLEDNKNYYIQYIVTTTNNLIISTPKYRIVQQYVLESQLSADIIPILNYEEGYIEISLEEKNNQIPVSGKFILSRSCQDDNYKVWNELYYFQLIEEIPNKILWRDFTVEQGKYYQYSIQQQNNNGLLSNRIASKPVYADFEYAFLYDGVQQLKIKFNPKISSLKVDVLESKSDTIGSKYPFIFRNGNVYYREFPISGLISYQMDEEELFITKENLYYSKDLLTDLGRTNTPNQIAKNIQEKDKITNLNSENIAAERLFKLQVLEWLTNGKIKLFRSPTEGNYIVRLMNVSLSPNDILGRMLHTFTCTAYEVAEYTYENLQSSNILQLEATVPEYRTWETVEFANTILNADGTTTINYKEPGIMNNFTARSVEFFDMRPGSMITLTFENGDKTDIRIGLNGRYSITDEVAIRSIETHGPTTGGMTYSYNTIMQSEFDKISKIHLQDIPARQFIGQHNIVHAIEYIYDPVTDTMVKNPKIDIVNFSYVYAYPRNIEKSVKVGNYYYRYYNDEQDNAFLTLFNPTALYAVGYWSNTEFIETYLYDYINQQEIALDDCIYELTINDSSLRISDTAIAMITNNNPALGGMVDYYAIKFIDLHDIGLLHNLQSSNGLITEVGYQIKITDYTIENNPKYATFHKKAEYEQAVQILKDYLVAENKNYSVEQEEIYRQDVENKYVIYISTLIQDLNINN